MASVVTLEFYDGSGTQYDLAWPVTNAEGVPGMAFVIPDQIGARTAELTEQQLMELQDDGWDVCYHDTSDYELPDIADSILYDRLHGMRQTLIRMGCIGGARFAAPYSFHVHEREKRELLRAGFIAIRSNQEEGKISPSATLTLQTPITSAHDAVAWGVVTAAIDAAAVAGNVILGLGFHGFVAAGPTGLQATPGRLQDCIDYVQTKSLEIVTWSELVTQVR